MGGYGLFAKEYVSINVRKAMRWGRVSASVRTEFHYVRHGSDHIVSRYQRVEI